MSEAKAKACWFQTASDGSQHVDTNRMSESDTPAVAVPLEDYMEVRSTMLETASYHMKDTETPYCRVCGASDGRWPCSARINADAVLALLPEVPHV